MIKPAALAMLALAVQCSAAFAATPSELYEQGHYEEAIAAGLAQKDAAGLTVAAHAELASGMTQTPPCLACFHRAEIDAWRATKLSDTPAEAYLYDAIALGQQGRLRGPIAALGHGYAKSARACLDAALSKSPNNAFVWAALGGWNIELVRNAGATLARWSLGANTPEGLSDFQKAFTLNPGNVAIRYQYALTLSGYDLDTYRPQIENALSLAATGKPQSAYEAFAQNRARELLDVLKKNDIDKYNQLVRRDQGYPP